MSPRKRPTTLALLLTVIIGVSAHADRSTPPPAKPLPSDLMQALQTPVSRAQAIDAALGNRHTLKALTTALPHLKPSPALATTTASGASIQGSLALPSREGPSVGRPVPVPFGIDGLDWDAGVFISPTLGAPSYRTANGAFRCADMLVFGIASARDYGLRQMIADDITMHMDEAAHHLRLYLPGHAGTYIVSIQMVSDLDMKPPRTIRLHCQRPGRPHEIALAPNSAGTGVIGVLTLPEGTEPAAQRIAERHGMEALSTHLIIETHGDGSRNYFGGITITRL